MPEDRKPDPAPLEEEDRATGSVGQPIPPGEVQPGEMNELAATLGGPVDVFPGRRRKPVQSGD
ncbi:hypothetical protein ACFFMP_04170 [Pseudoroseomonas cervicalis]|uniref:Uncharacterized protein n=1 Tax=Pseudoroseomonas cervicalis ATCC 49957 TaxID=525371 RepID=D5RKW6_9PROT|nr:hypothetical protein [Pseudoroseomonas cervicalis]EFH12061.1 hypothetical protein HMPREF0731_1726 [Pseudoroseomonas cervicalis ATCC 49957]